MGIHNNPIAFSKMYTQDLMSLFLRSFTEGLHYPAKRVRESEWRKSYARTIDSLWLCGCGAESFYESGSAAQAGGKTCWSCQKPLVLPPRIRIGSDVVLLNRNTRLFGFHVGLTRDDDNPIAEVVQNPQNPSVFGLRNLGGESWTLSKPDGSIIDVPPGKAAPILTGNRINFGLATGEIRA